MANTFMRMFITAVAPAVAEENIAVLPVVVREDTMKHALPVAVVVMLLVLHVAVEEISFAVAVEVHLELLVETVMDVVPLWIRLLS
jgi:hypothetical protein